VNVDKNQKEDKFVSLVVYMHNEEEYIEEFLNRILLYCESRFSKLELICVNDDCNDATLERLKKYLETHKSDTRISVIHMSYFHGLEASMNAGRDLSIGDIVYEFDHMQVDYEPQLIMKLYERMLEGVDIVTAGQKKKVPLTSRLFYFIYNLTSRTRGKIGPETFRVISKRAINRVKSMGEFIPYRKAVYRNCGLKTDMIYYQPGSGRAAGKTKSGGVERTMLAVDSFIYFTSAIERVSLGLSCLFLVITVVVISYIVYDFLGSGTKPVEGWVSTMGFMAFGFMGVFSLLTIVLKYLSVLLSLIFKKQKYLIENIEKMN